MDKPCSASCPCRSLAPCDFAFFAYKWPDRLEIEFHDRTLCEAVVSVVGPPSPPRTGPSSTPVTLDGFDVLARYEELKKQLHFLRTAQRITPLLATFHLLVDYFLTEHNVFESFGFENLYESGRLTFNHWKAFQRCRFEDDVGHLENLFGASDGPMPDILGAAEATSPSHPTTDSQQTSGQVANHPKPKPNEKLSGPLLYDQLLPEQLLLDQLLLDQGTDVNKYSRDHKRILHQAASNGHERVCRLLLDQGADVDTPNSDHDTPLFAAARNGHEGVCRQLLDQGADVDTPNSDHKSKTPLFAAAINSHEGICRLLLDRGADVNPFLLIYETPLFAAASNGHEGICRLLLSRRARVNTTNWNLETPLFAAASNGHEGVCRQLLDQGADVDTPNSDHETPLFAAASNGHEGVCRLLLAIGASVNGASADGDGVDGNSAVATPPLMGAARNGREGVCRLLLRQGAKPDSLTIHSLGSKSRQVILDSMLESRKRFTDGVADRKEHQQAADATRTRFALQCKAAIDLLESNPALTGILSQFSSPMAVWKCGLRTLRQIAAGNIPANLDGVLTFLCVCRATSEVLDICSISNRISEFQRDLWRWAILFDGQDYLLYQQVVRGLWGVVPQGAPEFDAAEGDLLHYAQTLVSSLVGEARSILWPGPAGQLDLRQSQLEWRQRRNHSHEGEPPPKDPDPPDDDAAQQPDPGGGIRELVRGREDSSSTMMAPKLVLLMSGAIFISLLVFLVCKSRPDPKGCL